MVWILVYVSYKVNFDGCKFVIIHLEGDLYWVKIDFLELQSSSVI